MHGAEDGNRCAWPDDSSRLVGNGAVLTTVSRVRKYSHSKVYRIPSMRDSPVLYRVYQSYIFDEKRYTRDYLVYMHIFTREKERFYLPIYKFFTTRRVYAHPGTVTDWRGEGGVGNFWIRGDRETRDKKFTSRTCSTANTPATNPTVIRRSSSISTCILTCLRCAARNATYHWLNAERNQYGGRIRRNRQSTLGVPGTYTEIDVAAVDSSMWFLQKCLYFFLRFTITKNLVM